MTYWESCEFTPRPGGGFSVAGAAQLYGVGLTIVRGFSNVAGERDRSRWHMQEALERAAGLVLEAAG